MRDGVSVVCTFDGFVILLEDCDATGQPVELKMKKREKENRRSSHIGKYLRKLWPLPFLFFSAVFWGRIARKRKVIEH